MGMGPGRFNHAALAVAFFCFALLLSATFNNSIPSLWAISGGRHMAILNDACPISFPVGTNLRN